MDPKPPKDDTGAPLGGTEEEAPLPKLNGAEMVLDDGTDEKGALTVVSAFGGPPNKGFVSADGGTADVLPNGAVVLVVTLPVPPKLKGFDAGAVGLTLSVFTPNPPNGVAEFGGSILVFGGSILVSGTEVEPNENDVIGALLELVGSDVLGTTVAGEDAFFSSFLSFDVPKENDRAGAATGGVTVAEDAGAVPNENVEPPKAAVVVEPGAAVALVVEEGKAKVREEVVVPEFAL